MKAGAAAYLVHLGGAGSKPSTLGTVKRTLDLLTEAMGEDKEVGKILPVHVDGFYKSEAATIRWRSAVRPAHQPTGAPNWSRPRT